MLFHTVLYTDMYSHRQYNSFGSSEKFWGYKFFKDVLIRLVSVLYVDRIS
jgi:hypothetical protein